MTQPPSAFRTDVAAGALARLIDGESSQLITEILRPTPNFWDIVESGDASKEIRYSKMIGWLLDPHRDHSLGTSFAQDFVDAVFGTGTAPTISPRAKVHPQEWRSIDILLVDYDEQGTPVLTLAIENKTASVEHMRRGLRVGQTTWYNWAIRGDFDRIRDAIAHTELPARGRAKLTRRVDSWEADPNDYRDVADADRWFVYLTPRHGETAEDPEFHTLTYEGLETILDKALDSLRTRQLVDAEKIVHDFRRTIHRRFDKALLRQIRALFAGNAILASAATGITPEITGLARRLDLIDPDSLRAGDEEYMSAAVDDEHCVDRVLEAIAENSGRTVSEMELQRLIAHIWEQRPKLVGNDNTKFWWATPGGKKLHKIEVLQHIARAFIDEHSIGSKADFQRQFGAIVKEIVNSDGPNPFIDREILYDPDVYDFSPSARRRYRDVEIRMRDKIGPIELDGESLRVHWRLGCKYDGMVGRIAHLPVIRYFMENGDPTIYPITEAS